MWTPSLESRFSLLPVSGDRGNKYPTIVLEMIVFTDILSKMIWRTLLSYTGIVGLRRKFPDAQISCGKAEIHGNGSLSLDSATQTAATSPIEQTHTGKTPAFLWDTYSFLSDPGTC